MAYIYAMVKIIKPLNMNVAVLLFEDFETLDVFGPVEILGRLKQDYRISFYSISGGLVNNNHGVSVLTKNIDDLKASILFVIQSINEQMLYHIIRTIR